MGCGYVGKFGVIMKKDLIEYIVEFAWGVVALMILVVMGISLFVAADKVVDWMMSDPVSKPSAYDVIIQHSQRISRESKELEEYAARVIDRADRIIKKSEQIIEALEGYPKHTNGVRVTILSE